MCRMKTTSRSVPAGSSPASVARLNENVIAVPAELNVAVCADSSSVWLKLEPSLMNTSTMYVCGSKISQGPEAVTEIVSFPPKLIVCDGVSVDDA